MSGVLLGVDVGTSVCKAAVVGLDGRELAHGRVPTPWRAVPTGAEVGADELFAAALEAVGAALAGRPGARVLAAGVTGMAETGVLTDGGGRPLAPAIAWHDRRGEAQAARLAGDLGARRFSERVGLPPSSMCTAAKLRWLREHHPAARRGRRWRNVAEWVVQRLGGDEVAELSLSSRTGFLELASGRPWSEALAWAGAPADLVPQPLPAGTAAGRARHGPSGLAGAVLTVAGHDHLCAAVGAGAVGPDDVFDSCGSAEAFVRAVTPPVPPAAVLDAVDHGVTVGWHALPGRQALLAGFLSGLALRRFLDLLGVDDAARPGLDRAALAAPTGCAGLVVDDVTGARASLTGIGRDVGPGLVWRAALEAVARHGADLLAHMGRVAGPHRRLLVSGGWAASPATRAVKSAALGAFELPRLAEAGCRGAALLAGVAAGLYPSADELPAVASARVSPDARR